jgi:aspartyl-tRNA(Asn)/glutamyl-tRNA(Gln) amidotransferase subunit A
MTASPLHELSAAEAGPLLRSGRLTSGALVESALARIRTLDPCVNAFITVTEEHALERAAQADRELASGVDRGPLHGIPYALKDIFDTAGIRTTCHSRLFEDHVPAEDSTVVARLNAGGAVLLGKLSTHELALGGPSFDLPFPPARNPWNLEHFTGASSSGCAAAVAAGFVPITVGSDTSGSIRGPACQCGAVGLKPTYGLVSRRGVFPLSYALDHCGPLTWTVRDAALALQVIAGFDPLDPSSVDVAVPDYDAALRAATGGLTGLRIGVLGDFVNAPGVSREVRAALEEAACVLRRLGAVVDEAEFPPFELFNACGRVIMTAESYAIHEEALKTRPLDFGRYTFQRIVPGAALSAADLIQASRVRRELTEAVNTTVFRQFDALLAPCCLAPAARLADFPADWPPPAAATATQTIPFNVTGNPVLALPTGKSHMGLPLGMQIAGRIFEERTILRIGAAYEAATQHNATRPSLRADARGRAPTSASIAERGALR